MVRDIARHCATDFEEITTDQEKAIAAFLAGLPVREAAMQAGINRGTLHRWLVSDPVFIAAYNLARNERAAAVRHELRMLGTEAVKVVGALLTCAETPPSLKLKAAFSVLETASEEHFGSTDVAEIKLQLKEKVRRRKDRKEMLTHFD